MKIKSFGVVKTATIGAIVTAALIAVPLMCFVLVMASYRLVHPLPKKLVASEAAKHGRIPTTEALLEPSPMATATAGCEPSQTAAKKPPQPFRVRDGLLFLAFGSVFYGIFGFLLFGLWAYLYNVLSPRLGAIEIELTEGAEEHLRVPRP